MFKQQSREWKNAQDNVDATVVDKDESTFVRSTFQPLQPLIKVVIQPWSSYNSITYAGQAQKL